MTQFATIAFLGKAGEAPAEHAGFINFRAGLDGREPDSGETVAVLRIGSTECFHVLLLDRKRTMKDIVEELAGIDAVLGADARHRLEPFAAKGKKTV